MNNKNATFKLKSEIETSSEDLIRLNSEFESLCSLALNKPQTDEINEILSEIIDLNPTRGFQEYTLPKATQKEHFIKNTSCIENIIHGKTYIKLCIDSGVENIYNIYLSKVHLLELEVSVMFSDNSAKVFCLPCYPACFNDEQLLFEHLQSEYHVKTIHQLQKNHKCFKPDSRKYSDLILFKNCMRKISNAKIYCCVCNYQIKNDEQAIGKHITNSNHNNKSLICRKNSQKIFKKISSIYENVWYYAEYFICQFCEYRCKQEIEFAAHLENSHLNRKSKGNVIFGMCHVCTTFWCSKSDDYTAHCKGPFHKRFRKSKELQIPKLTIAAHDLLKNADEKIISLVQSSNDTILDINNENKLLKIIKYSVRKLYPNAEAHIFGSRLSYLAFPDSDMDIFLDCNISYNKSDVKKCDEMFLESVKKCFDLSDWVIKETTLLTRTPILKLQHIPTGINCDISFTNGLSVEKSKLIRYYNNASNTCRELILYLKQWLNVCHLSGSYIITTFAISWYVIFYLQVHKIVPSVYELLDKRKLKIVDGWDCNFNEVPVVKTPLNFKHHLKGFFSYYANFDYKTNVACPYLGKIIRKHSFVFVQELPEELNCYKQNIEKNCSKTFRFDSPMCIQDPVDLSQNITKAVLKMQLLTFKQYCLESFLKICY